jgi:TetR/AcrR family transcriptional regulator, transcriptional repressor for nem operon
VGRPKEFDVDEALAKAMEVFWAKGYDGASVCDLTAGMGVQKASLYGTFGDKRSLFVAALDRYQEAGCERVRERLESGASPRTAIREFFFCVAQEAAADDAKKGCFCVNAAVELAPHDAAVAEQMRRHAERMESLLKKAIERGVAAGELSKSIEAGPAARFLYCVLLGLHVVGKTGPGEKKLKDIVRVALAVLDGN